MPRVILIGNYPNDKQESMQRFAGMLFGELKQDGRRVDLITPQAILGRLKPSATGFGKWLGYIDKFLLFPFTLRSLAKKAKVDNDTIFHICDHSNAMYERWLRDVPHLITCHDLLAVRSALGEIPQNRTKGTGLILQSWIRTSLSNCKYVACVSKFTEGDVHRLTNHSFKTTSVVYNALNYPYGPASSEGAINAWNAANDSRIPEAYLFHIGGTQWYKNREGLIEIYAELKRIDPNCPKLVVAGKPHTAKVKDLIKQHQLEDSVLHVGRISNELLQELYTHARAFLFPSLAEGFGWPIIEAQACGCPVVTTNRAPMNEIGGPAATYIDPESPEKAAISIAELLKENDHQRTERSAQSVEHAAQFNQAKMIEEYKTVYQELAQRETH